VKQRRHGASRSTRRTHTARDDQHFATARIAALEKDIARRVTTRGDAFAMEVEGRATTDRKVAGGALLSKLRMAALARTRRDWTIGRIGGFDLTCRVRRNLGGSTWSAELTLVRTDDAQPIEIEDDLTTLGLISRLEYVLDHFEVEIEQHEHRRADAASRLAGYEARLGEAFQLQGELDDKLAQMAALEADLAATVSATAEAA
jgi:hypothetical protein